MKNQLSQIIKKQGNKPAKYRSFAKWNGRGQPGASFR